MTFGGTTRHKYPALLLAVMLGFAVFFWGLQYKLSLYHAAGAPPCAPAAKLLSQRERASCTIQLERAIRARRPVHEGSSGSLLHMPVSDVADAYLVAGLETGSVAAGFIATHAAERWRTTLCGPRAPPIAA